GIDWHPGDVVLVATSEEYPSNVYPWQRLARRGVELRAVPAPGGRLDPAAFAAAGDARTRLIAVSSVQYATGVRVDLPALGQLCRDRGWWLCVDGIQSLGVLPCDVKAAGVHFLAADSHKWMLGLPGIGVLFVDRSVVGAIEPALIGWRSTKTRFDFDRVALDLRDDALRFEEGNLPYALIEGMGAAIDLLLDARVERIRDHVFRLNDVLVERLRRDGHTVTSPTDAARSGSVVFRPKVGDPVAIAEALHRAGVILSCRRGALRVSPHLYNTADEVLTVADRLETAAGGR
ncbi:MAG: aminotransferase class V-fold PLP-dependent enzyme, partial [Myxococcota bacterium]